MVLRALCCSEVGEAFALNSNDVPKLHLSCSLQHTSLWLRAVLVFCSAVQVPVKQGSAWRLQLLSQGFSSPFLKFELHIFP